MHVINLLASTRLIDCCGRHDGDLHRVPTSGRWPACRLDTQLVAVRSAPCARGQVAMEKSLSQGDET